MFRIFWLLLLVVGIVSVAKPASGGIALGGVVEATALPDGTTQYTVINDSENGGSPFNIAAFVIAEGTNPFSRNHGWVSQPLSAAAWDQPMGGPGVPHPTWQQYTGFEFDKLFPTPPANLNGFFLQYTFDAAHSRLISYPPDEAAIPPALSLSNFFTTGRPMGGRFVISGPAFILSPTPVGDVQTFSGLSQFGGQASVPLPSATAAAIVMVPFILAGCWWRRREARIAALVLR